VPIVYAAVTAVLYGRTLGIFFVSDDFEFLQIVAHASSVSVIFEPLVGRFVRPLVVLMYYLNYQAIGLSPWGYHLSTLAPHVLNGWLVYLIAKRLGDGREAIWAFLAGLLFVVFSGHSEAVSWPAGIADPILTVCLLSALLCYLRALEPGAPVRWLAGMFAAVLAATQAKELWVVFPGLLVAHAVAFGWPGPRERRRAVIAIAGTAGLVVAYLAMRHLVFGSVAGGYAGLGSSLQGGIFAAQARAFVLRSFAPGSEQLAHRWLRGDDLIFWPGVILLLAWLARGRALRVLVFTAFALVIALAPVLPLTISINTSESERFVYFASAFSCIFFVQATRTLFRRRWLAIAICAMVIAGHSAALVRANAQWEASGQLTRGIVDSFADQALAHDPAGTGGIFILNLPDNVGGAYVFRNGFYSAVKLVRPEVAGRTGRTFGIATQSVGSAADQAHVVRPGGRIFAIDFGSNQVIQPEIPSNGLYRIVSQTRQSYEVAFTDSIDSALVLYLTGGRLASAGTARGQGLPFGFVDIPGDGAICHGESIRVAGWALDNEGVARVMVSAPGSDGEATTLGEAEWASGDRPDIARNFSGFPEANRAGWDFHLPCASVALRPEGAMRIRMTAYDDGGGATVLGERVIRAAR
jgi:protein O-mannosyl-transferase